MPVADRRCEDQDVGLADRFLNFGTIDPECAPAAQFCFAGIATLGGCPRMDGFNILN